MVGSVWTCAGPGGENRAGTDCGASLLWTPSPVLFATVEYGIVRKAAPSRGELIAYSVRSQCRCVYIRVSVPWSEPLRPWHKAQVVEQRGTTRTGIQQCEGCAWERDEY